MNRKTDWPHYLISRAIAEPPIECSVVEGTTPVVAFGNPVTAQVATLGINPSCNEFLNRSGELLAGNLRRLATLKSLGVEDRTALDDSHGRAVLDGCADYFNVRSYGWFKPLNRILSESLGVSYGRTACHLDLVQWATKPVWRGLNDAIRTKLLDDGVRFLVRQLEMEQCRLIIINGRTVMKTVEAAGITAWRSASATLSAPTTDLYIGDSGSQRFLAWSCNIQSQPGARRHIEALIAFVKEYAGFNLLPEIVDLHGAST